VLETPEENWAGFDELALGLNDVTEGHVEGEGTPEREMEVDASEWVVLSEELCILANCLLSPMSSDSVLEELSVKRLAVIQEEICCRAF